MYLVMFMRVMDRKVYSGMKHRKYMKGCVREEKKVS